MGYFKRTRDTLLRVVVHALDIVFLLRHFGLEETKRQIEDIDRLRIIVRVEEPEWIAFNIALCKMPDRVIPITRRSQEDAQAEGLCLFPNFFHRDGWYVADGVTQIDEEHDGDAQSSKSSAAAHIGAATDPFAANHPGTVRPPIIPLPLVLYSYGAPVPSYFIQCPNFAVDMSPIDLLALFDIYERLSPSIRMETPNANVV